MNSVKRARDLLVVEDIVREHVGDNWGELIKMLRLHPSLDDKSPLEQVAYVLGADVFHHGSLRPWGHSHWIKCNPTSASTNGGQWRQGSRALLLSQGMRPCKRCWGQGKFDHLMTTE